MKKVFFIMVVVAMSLATNWASAQPGGDRIKENVERLTKYLQLTEAQVTEIEGIYKVQADNRKKQFDQMRQIGQRPDMQAMRAQMAKERADIDAQIAKVLTPEQNEKYKQMQEEWSKKHAEHKKGDGKMRAAHGDGSRFSKMKEELGLSEQQIKQLKQLNHDQMVQRQEEIKKILTPEQYEKLQKMKKSPAGKKR